MIDYRDLVAKFISVLEDNNLVEHVDIASSIVKIETKRYYIFVYYPDVPKADVALDKPIIHLDVDLLFSSFAKTIFRIKGIHNQGERLYARQVVVARVDKKNSMEFQEDYHLQRALPGKYRYGLFYQGELVSIAVFSGARLKKDEADVYRSFELIRFCHKSDISVVGGVSKLIKAFVADFQPQDIMTYSDRDWGQDSSLITIGFEEVGDFPPVTFYVKDGIRKSMLKEEDTYDYCVENTGSIKLKMFL